MINIAIDIGQIEEYQMLKDMQELERIFNKAKSTVVQGGTVILRRRHSDGSLYIIDEITSESDLISYKEKVFKYLV